MAINKKLIHFKKLADFETRLANNEILNTSIVFIQDANKIWTHGTYYDGSDLEQYALKSSIPTKVSLLQNDSGYVNSIPTELNVVENLEIGSIIQDSVFYDFESEGKPVIVLYNSRNYFISKFDILHAAEGIVYAYSIIDNILYTLEIGVSPYNEDVEGYNVLNIDEIQKTFYFTESFDINEFALKSSLPTKTSQLTNDSNFITNDSFSLLRNYAKGTASHLKVTNFDPDTSNSNTFIYPVSGLKHGDTVTISFDLYYKSSTDQSDDVRSAFLSDTGSANITFNLGTNYGYQGFSILTKDIYDTDAYSGVYELKLSVNKTITISSSSVTADTVTDTYISCNYFGHTGGSGYIEISNFRITKSNVAMPWSSAPEDCGKFIWNRPYSNSYVIPGVYCKYNTMTSLSPIFTITADTNTVMSEYLLEFTSSSSGTSLTLPSTIKWMNGEAPTLEANKTYQISIVNNLAICGSFG